MPLSRVEKLYQTGISFGQVPGKDLDRRRLRRECNRIYRAALERVDRIAEHVDEVNALMSVPFERMELSGIFSKRQADLMLAMDVEWLSDPPDLKVFCGWVADWEECCMVELRSWMEKLRQVSR